MNTELMFSSKTNEWETPKELFDQLDDEFRFTLDPCASNENYKCDYYFTKEKDGLKESWEGETVFCNPPYGRSIKEWVKKAYKESRNKNTVVVMLIPARTDTTYFHDYIYGRSEIRFIKGRLLFIKNGKNPNKSERAPFPSMIVIFKG